MPSVTAPTERMTRREILILLTVACAQLLVILDTTIVNIAVPLAARDLGLTAESRQWIITAYALPFGAVLLIGGRIADYWGRKRAFILGIALFGVASLWGGLAHTGVELLLARGLQGASAALLAPAALSIVTVTFSQGRSRTIAFGLLGGIMSGGAAVGIILGGVLTEFAGWRWCLFINVPFVVIALLAGLFVLTDGRAPGKPRYDVLGAITVALGLAAIVFGLTRAESGLLAGGALPIIAGGVVLLVAFVLIERRAAAPLLPLRVILHRTRGGAMLVQLCSGGTMIGATLYVTVHLQQVLGMSPLWSGVASLPLALAVVATMPFLIALMPKVGLKPVLVGGTAVATVGVALLGRVTEHGSYAGEVLPGLIVMGIGMAGIFAPAQNLALQGVEPRDAGAASAVSNAANQVGGAIGLALLTNVYVTVSEGDTALSAVAQGNSAAFLAAAVPMGVAFLVALFVVKAPRGSSSEAASEARVLAAH